MKNHPMKTVTALIIEEDNLIPLDAVCHSLSTEKTFLVELISHDIIRPQRINEAWQFDSLSFRRTKLAVSFYHDLGINLEGIALALDLIDRLEANQ